MSTTIFIDGAWQPARRHRPQPGHRPRHRRSAGAPCRTEPPKTSTPPSAPPGARFDAGEWPRLTPSERAAYLLRIADEVEKRAEELSLTNTRENGSPVAESAGAAANAAGIFRYFATLAGYLEARGRPRRSRAAAASPWSGATRWGCAR